jgi:hypothetical protein
MRHDLRSLPILVALLAACGGKIVDDGRAVGSGAGGSTGAGSSGTSGEGSGGSSGSSGSFGPAPAEELPSPPSSALSPGASSGTGSVTDACETVCRRNAKCGALQTDCNDRCAEELAPRAACAGPASAFIQCFANNLPPDDCTALPPVCESAYCAYTRCTGKVVPSYCP